MEYLLTALIIGLFSSVHCLGMCGGIAGALAWSLPAGTRDNRIRLAGYLGAYSVGRVGSYALAGAAVGWLGSGIHAALSPRDGYLLLQWIAALLMTGIGLYIAGWFPRLAHMERLGLPLWRRLEPIGRHLIPVKGPGHALLYGLVWGWLPCGLVYSALLLAVATGSPERGASFMLAFGAGTLPAVLGMGMLAQWMGQLSRRMAVRRVAGLLLVAMGLAGVLFTEELHRLAPLSQQENLQCRP